jgi:hypothetical protein
MSQKQYLVMSASSYRRPEGPYYAKILERRYIYGALICGIWHIELDRIAAERGNISVHTMVKKGIEDKYPLSKQLEMVEEQNISMATLRRNLMREVFDLSEWDHLEGKKPKQRKRDGYRTLSPEPKVKDKPKDPAKFRNELLKQELGDVYSFVDEYARSKGVEPWEVVRTVLKQSRDRTLAKAIKQEVGE